MPRFCANLHVVASLWTRAWYGRPFKTIRYVFLTKD